MERFDPALGPRKCDKKTLHMPVSKLIHSQPTMTSGQGVTNGKVQLGVIALEPRYAIMLQRFGRGHGMP